jgi:hypothetical protein
MHMAWKRATSWVDQAIGELSRGPHGIFTIAQLVPPRWLKIEGKWLAAVLACGPGAALSHLSAAAFWDMIRFPSSPIDVIVPSHSGRRKRARITIHRSSTLLPSQITVENSIPVTTPARRLSDLCRSLPRYRFEPILRRAEKLRLDTGLHPNLEDPDRTELERRFRAGLAGDIRFPCPTVR